MWHSNDLFDRSVQQMKLDWRRMSECLRPTDQEHSHPVSQVSNKLFLANPNMVEQTRLYGPLWLYMGGDLIYRMVLTRCGACALGRSMIFSR